MFREGATDAIGRARHGSAHIIALFAHQPAFSLNHPRGDGIHGFLQGVSAHFRVVTGESPILENGVAEQVSGGHRHNQAGFGQRAMEGFFDRLHLSRRGVDRDQVIIVEVDTVGAHFSQQMDELSW